MLTVDHLNLTLGEFSLNEIQFSIPDGEYTVILGPTGTGKSVLIESLLGFHALQSGSIRWSNDDITANPIHERPFSWVSQTGSLFPHLNVRENVAYPLKVSGKSSSEIKELLDTLSAQCQITDLLDRRPGDLSGGETQRVALARALASEPGVLILDEPLSSVDVESRRMLRRLLRDINSKGQTILHVTHDFEEAAALATSLIVLEKGTLVNQGKPQDVLQHPKSEFLARFVGIRNVLKGSVKALDNNRDVSLFESGGFKCEFVTENESESGTLLIRSEDLIIASSPPQSSARNSFEGTIVDIIPARLGVEVMIDVGVELAALVTHQSAADMQLDVGKSVWISIKATAPQYIGD
jgi:molybdopterin-binding protein